MNRLGHSTPAAALRYQHATNDRYTQIAHALSPLATGNPYPPKPPTAPLRAYSRRDSDRSWPLGGHG